MTFLKTIIKHDFQAMQWILIQFLMYTCIQYWLNSCYVTLRPNPDNFGTEFVGQLVAPPLLSELQQLWTFEEGWVTLIHLPTPSVRPEGGAGWTSGAGTPASRVVPVSSRPLVGGGRGASSQPFFWIRQKYQRVIKDSASKGCANVMVCICNESKWVWRLLCCSRVK